MIKKLLVLFFICSSLTSFCQDKQLLENYKYRVNKYKAVDIGLGTGGQSNNNYNGYGGSRVIGGVINPNIFTIKSTDKIYRTIQANLIGNFAFTTNNSITSTRKTRELYVSPTIDINNKWYSGNNFFELGSNIKTENKIDNSKVTRGSLSNNIHSDNNIDINLTLGIGTGRLEIITDMQNALWLTKILQEQNNLNRKLTHHEINDLAKTITQSIYFRVLDGRRRVQFVLKKIDAYLQSKSVIASTDINYFTNLNDVVFFANNFFRQAGTIKFMRVIPRLQNNLIVNEQLIINKNKDVNKYFQNGTSLRIGFEKYKPINLFRQLEYGLAMGAVYTENKFSSKRYIDDVILSDTRNNFYEKKIGLDYFVRYKLYPNTRTVIEFSFNGQNGYLNYDKNKSIYTGLNVFTGANYFINYNTRFVFNIQEYYFQNIYLSNTSLNQNTYGLSLAFNAGLNISL